ncbi:MAG: hypothetical protein A2315_15240 [Ignavibacteria bacterium RIFOXYB2_FULL_35_12]|nr:MAG: hypothetical protein A2058_08865 [Ignavibacteria bacterium GWA2_36_19]OGU62387.1 MAG: hypothetical protein A2X60_13890 [Ignavibacteria bacterium GWF2_35_20]OGU79232.1 MAG: hypothetical protein A2254_07680 [Ignavibacteria bacterium RIFOXYA2_FULL_35_9]OGU86296.1 MAG: hypothetical protein A3K31_02350 [Ignavibacteria bacterium RIFOXYA12_FULL_35_25]OGU97606.1 MAG: hypothetical protein A2347_09105 [Ignavibacteria bacterium RIFOXYB12_FULL_35_14]OGV00528.1 MAG: hypothetical protein A2455_16790
MNKYPKYKLAGVEWIGDIPEHWEVERTKWVFSESKLRNRELKYVDEDLLSVSEYYGVAKRREIIDNNDILNRAESLSENKIVIKGELVINIMLAWKKGLGISDHNGIVSPSYCVFKLLVDKGDPKFFHYLYRTNLYAEVFRQNSRGIIDSRLRLYPEEFFNIITIVPSPEEQTAIANFLDEKTAQIDKLITNKQKLIELLKEERTAIINQAVTRGIVPNVKLKPSGIEWLGNIPEHWAVKKLKYMAKLKSGESITSDNIREADEYAVYGGNGLRGYTSTYTHDGDYILIGRQGALCGNINYAFGKFFASEHAVVVTRFNDEHIFWLGELLRSMNLNQYSISAAQPGLSVERIQNLSIPYPQIDEQELIGKHIETETKRIDNTISKIEREIELLQEYRTALISEVVTGKIDVRNTV